MINTEIMSIAISIVTAIIRALMVEMILRDNIRGRLDYRDFYHTPLPCSYESHTCTYVT